MKIIVRNADNDFDAYRIAQAMTDAGADVFSIAHNGMHQPYGAMVPSAKFIVFAKHADSISPETIDKYIDAESLGLIEGEK
jgi:hypothetical protein